MWIVLFSIFKKIQFVQFWPPLSVTHVTHCDSLLVLTINRLLLLSLSSLYHQWIAHSSKLPNRQRAAIWMMEEIDQKYVIWRVFGCWYAFCFAFCFVFDNILGTIFLGTQCQQCGPTEKLDECLGRDAAERRVGMNNGPRTLTTFLGS